MNEPRPVRLYDFPFSGNGYKVRLALTQAGPPVEYTPAHGPTTN